VALFACEPLHLRVLPQIDRCREKEAQMAKDHGSSVKNDKQYEGLRKKGMSKGRVAAISNARGSSSRGGKKSGGGSSSGSSGGSKSQKAAAGRKGGKSSS
jgi:hypothetical protein